ncbi:acrylyl-CoA reductase (NADPH) [Methylopila capsulata]|uniref:Acrylyl-CoA reductase (NADPH) n=1 Tax=Methylopila capsulata TaxID=61654 RepID=A0A9W6IYE4_9HYPH|nr:MDR family oxidoreductase [Methylopila capsulata]MBM7853211.1 acrylyl-CoA reductase (NADPH) [Methylopila capsulata]GLK57575.1 alcohol dehydrogenase [Methylopila capsulata]
MSTFRALRIDKGDAGQTLSTVDFDEAELMDGDVVVRVSHSTVNYKDGLAITGKSPVVRRFPMIPGIDFAGKVTASTTDEFKVGDEVVLNGWGVGETHLGGYAEIARVPAAYLVPLPEGLTPAESMAVGTAGYTAMLCVMALERHGVTPERGSVLVTGAAGGVGSVAVALLAKLGYEVVASTGRESEAGYLRDLGAARILPREELAAPGKPLQKEIWGGVIDSVGSVPLANAIAQTKSGGAVAACGLAAGMDLPTSVAPFILRGVSLLGINSVTVPKPIRIEAWGRLAKDLDRAKLAAMTKTISFDEIVPTAEAILEGKVRGRVVVEI